MNPAQLFINQFQAKQTKKRKTNPYLLIQIYFSVFFFFYNLKFKFKQEEQKKQIITTSFSSSFKNRFSCHQNKEKKKLLNVYLCIISREMNCLWINLENQI